MIEMSILIATPILVVWALRAWYKRQGASGMAQTTGKGLGILATVTGAVLVLFGKAAWIFFAAGANTRKSNNDVTGHFNHITGEVDHGPGAYTTEDGSVELRNSPYSN